MIGVSTPASVWAMIETVARKIEIGQLVVHFHDTSGQDLEHIYDVL
jgi:isopropylmalate/homocitrate/citramalate synthase